MKFTIITHVEHIKYQNNYFGYAPYIREMNIWLKYVDEVVIVAPLVTKELNPIHEQYLHNTIQFKSVKEFNITSLKNIMITFFRLPNIITAIFKAMSQADHIHLRCPGNMGLIAAFVQIFFPNKQKSAKYAGNWDPKAKQPFSYKLQKWILSNTLLTRNMQVLVYGDWPKQSENIKPFFTATYSEKEILKKDNKIKNLPTPNSQLPTSFLFVGTLSIGKQPLYAIQLVEKMYQKGENVSLNLYGEGVLNDELRAYVVKKKLDTIIVFNGNQTKEILLEAYKNSHFLILPSKSEGWPKVVAEAMFWGCVPIVTPVSCVSYMLNHGKNGILLQEDVEIDVTAILKIVHSNSVFQDMVKESSKWSRQFTTDKFEAEIKKIMEHK